MRHSPAVAAMVPILAEKEIRSCQPAVEKPPWVTWTPSVIGGELSRLVDGMAWRTGFMLLSVIDAVIVT